MCPSHCDQQSLGYSAYMIPCRICNRPALRGHCPHFIDKEAEALRREVACPWMKSMGLSQQSDDNDQRDKGIKA